MKLCSIGYCPPKSFIGASAFYENIRRFKTKHDLLLFSEADWPEVNIKLKMSPEQPFMQQKGGKMVLVKPHKFAINNVLWFTAMQMARNAGYSHALYLEADVRVGCDFWDARMFDEYFGLGRALVCGGTVATYNPCNWSRKASSRWEQLVVENAMRVQQKPFDQCRKNVPISTYGWKGADQKHPSCVFPNGALSIVSLSWMHELFDLSQPAVKHAHNAEPFDMALGVRIWAKFEEESYDVIGHLNSSYSGFGEIATDAEERKRWLVEGRYVAVHQIKDEFQP